MNANEKLPFQKQIILLVVGGLLSAVPMLIVAHMQTRSQRENLLLERRIIALRDYSATYNRLAAEILPRVRAASRFWVDTRNRWEKKARDILKNTDSSQAKMSVDEKSGKAFAMVSVPIDKEMEKRFDDFEHETAELKKQLDLWQIELVAQTAVVNAVFDSRLDLPKTKLPFDEKKMKNVSKAERVALAESLFTDLENALDEVILEGCNNFRSLAEKIKNEERERK